MSVLERLDVAINKAHSEAHEVVELDLTPGEYAELMTFANQFDAAALEQLQLDLTNQTYRGYPLVIDKDIPQSGVIRDDGAEPLPDDDMARLSGHLTVGEGLLQQP